MNDSRSYITLDFRNTHMPVVVKAKRGDTARTLYISLADGGTPYRIADGCYATFMAKKPDRTVINNSCTIEKNMIVYPFTEQTCSVAGRITAEIRLYGSNGRMLTSASFILEVHKTVFNEGDVPASEDDINALDALILETLALKEELERKLENGEFDGEQGPAGPQGPAGDGGVTRDALKLLVQILQEALYGSNQAYNIKLLAEKLGVELEDDPGTDEPDVPDEPDIPDKPDSPVVYISTAALGIARLGYMRLTGTKGESPEEPDHSGVCDTTSALGVAKLGYTHLGDKYEV